MRHPDLSPDQGALAVSIAQKAVRLARGASTARPGTVFIPNGDGTGTLIGPGSAAGGIAEWVGDTEPPGRPTGITCKTSWGALYVEWDGTLEGGVPSDFSHVSVLVDDAEIGRMTGAGTLVQSGYADGKTLRVTAIAYDSAHDTLGNPAPNASGAFGPVEVAISDERAEIDADVAEIQKKADQASEDAADASSKADALQGEVSDVKTAINGVETELNGLSTKVEGAVSDANEALTTATEAKQTATGVRTTADRAYENAEEAIMQSSTAVQTAAEVRTALETDYQTKGDAAASYASKSELAQTSESIKSEVSRTYAVKSDVEAAKSAAEAAQGGVDALSTAIPETYATKSSVEQTAESIRSEVGRTYQPKGDYATSEQLGSFAERSYVDQKAGDITSAVEAAYVSKTDASKTFATKTEVKQEADSIKSTVGEVRSTAESAFEKASTVEQTASGITIRLDQTVKNVTAAQSAADAAAGAASSAQSTANAANTAAGKAQTAASGASTAASNAQSAATKAQSTADSAASAASKAASDASAAKSTASTANTTANAAKTAAGNAAKTATNYLKFDSSGLCVGNMSGALGKNTLIGASGIDMRDGTSVLARFTSTLVEIGRNAITSAIQMCGGALRVSASKSATSADVTIASRMVSSGIAESTVKIMADGGGPDAYVRVCGEDNTHTDNPAGGQYGTVEIAASNFYMIPGGRRIPLHDGHGYLSLVNATARDAAFRPRWVRRGGWTQLQGRVTTTKDNATVCSLKGIIDPLDIPPSGVNRNFACFTTGAGIVCNVYINSAGNLIAVNKLDLIDLSAISFRSA